MLLPALAATTSGPPFAADPTPPGQHHHRPPPLWHRIFPPPIFFFLLFISQPLTMSSSSHNTHEDTSSITDPNHIPIPLNLRFIIDSLKALTLNPLTQTNHLNWSTQVEEFFDVNSYTTYLDPNTPTPPLVLLSPEGHQTPNPLYPQYNLINKTLLGSLRSTISSSLKPLVLCIKTVVQFWTTLATHFQSQTRSRLTYLRAELHTLKMRGND